MSEKVEFKVKISANAAARFRALAERHPVLTDKKLVELSIECLSRVHPERFYHALAALEKDFRNDEDFGAGI